MIIIDIFEQIDSRTEARVAYLLQNARGEVTVRINSYGGAVVPALNIYNQIKAKQCTVEVLGLAASAASMIAMAGAKVKAASNALFMFHPVKTMLFDYYSKQDLNKLSETLNKFEESILAAYRGRVEGFEMPENDLWLSAQEAKSLGFVDEVIDEVPVVMDANNLFINSIAYDAAKVKGLKERLHPTPQGNAPMQTLIDLIKDQMQSGSQSVLNQTPPTPEEIKAAQIARIVMLANGGAK